MENIGQRIRRLRQERGMNRQAELCALVDVTQSTLSDIESKNKSFSAVVLMQLSKALTVSPGYIVYGGEEEDMGAIELIEVYNALPKLERELLLRAARSFLPNEHQIKAA